MDLSQTFTLLSALSYSLYVHKLVAKSVCQMFDAMQVAHGGFVFAENHFLLC